MKISFLSPVEGANLMLSEVKWKEGMKEERKKVGKDMQEMDLKESVSSKQKILMQSLFAFGDVRD